MLSEENEQVVCTPNEEIPPGPTEPSDPSDRGNDTRPSWDGENTDVPIIWKPTTHCTGQKRLQVAYIVSRVPGASQKVIN